AAGGVVRGLLVGAAVTVVSLLFTHLSVQHLPVIVAAGLLTSLIFALGGFLNALFAKNFDQVNWIPTFVLTPLTYFGGVFYSVTLLPQWAQQVSYVNPILHMVNAFRFGFLGVSDVSVGLAFALLRSAWDYTERLPEFLDWIERVDAITTLLNPAPVLRWSADKHYLRDLERLGVPVVATTFVEPGADARETLGEFLEREVCAELVVKPAVGAGSRDTRRHARGASAETLAHVRELLDAHRAVLLQPYFEGVDQHGETALIYVNGR